VAQDHQRKLRIYMTRRTLEARPMKARREAMRIQGFTLLSKETRILLESRYMTPAVRQLNRSPKIRRTSVIQVLLGALLFCFASVQMWAQAGIDMGGVTGTVKDPSGALVIHAQCTLTNTDTGVTQTTVSTSAGAYTFSLVSAGNYSLKVTASGFKESSIDGIVVHLGTTDTEDVRLQLGAVTEHVSVTSAAPLLQAQDASLGMTVDNTAATELPIFGGSGGRSFMTLATIAPGVQFSGNNSSTGTFLINGVQSGAVDVRVNGADDNAEVFGGITIPPIPDTIEELKLQTGDNPAELGHSYGTVVNVVTMSGTNKFHGHAWEYNENDMYNANDYFTKRSELLHSPSPLPNRPGRFKENSFGAIYGGPVILPGYNGRNKTFFTADFQYTYYTDTPTYTGTLPTGTMQSSNFTNLVDIMGLSKTTKVDGIGRTFQQGTILDPATTRWVPCGTNDPITGLTANCTSTEVGVVTDPTIDNGAKVAMVRDPYFQELGPPPGCPALAGTTNWVSTFAGGTIPTNCFNQLPAGRIDPNAVKLLQLFKAYTPNNVGYNSNGVNTATGSYASNFFELLPRPINTKQYDARIDHKFNDIDSSMVTFSHYNQTQQQQPPFQGALEGGGSTPFWTTNPTYMVVLTETHVFNPQLVNEARLSDEHNWNTRMDPGSIDNTFGVPGQFGIQGIPQNVNNGGLPDISIGSSISEFGSRTNVTWQKVGAWQFSDNLTKSVGRHEWKFGGEYWWTYGDIAQLPWSRGHFTYGQYSNVPGSGDGGPSMTDFLLNPTANVPNSSYTGTGANLVSTATTPLGGVNGYNGNNWNKSTYHAPYIALYAVDSFKITPALTLNLGIREDYFGPYYADGGSESEGNFWMGGDGNQANGSAYYIAQSGCAQTLSPSFKGLLASDNIPIICQPNNAANKTPRFNWAPRVSFAYRVRSNVVVRAGGAVTYGAFNSIGYGGTLGTNYPFRVSVQQGPQYSYRPQVAVNATGSQTATMENTFGIIDMTSALNAYQPLGSVVLYGKPYNFHIPYEEMFNVAVQYQFTNHDSIQATWIAQLGKQLESANPYHNAPRQALPSSSAVVTPCTASQLAANPYCENSPLMPDGTTTIPFPNLAALEGPIENTEQISNYEAGEVEYQHQFGGGFNMDANYTYTNCLSDAQGGQQNDGGPGNGRAPWLVGFGGYRADYDRCSGLATNVFKLSGEYGLPFGKGAHWAANANMLEDAFIGGWKLDPIWIAESGTLLNVGCQGTVGGSETTAGFTGPWFQTSGTAWGCNAPLVPGVNRYTPGPSDLPRSKVNGYFNSTAFTAPANPVTAVGQTDFTPWGVRGNQIYGPGWYDVDLAIHKQFKITETTKFELGAQALNAFNHVHLSNPSVSGYTKPTESLTSGFGTITGDASNNGSGRIWQLVGKLFF
jgi:hypothetical protein